MTTGAGAETRIGQRAGVAPGEGERRAQRGYVPQYDLAARVIYAALAAGRLRWIGLADRGAGAFDDVVLGLRDRIVAHQVKTSLNPEPFSLPTLMLGADDLLGRMLESRRRLHEAERGALVETVYVCDDYPRTNDRVGDARRGGSSAAFLRAHRANRSRWSLAEWRASRFGAFVAEAQAASGLCDEAFDAAWRNMRFEVGGQGRSLDQIGGGAADEGRLRALAGLLPRLVADPADRDRWAVGEVLERLGWTDPLGLRHGHAFPVDALRQSNTATEAELQRALAAAPSGYVGLVGPPGCGKSTLLASGKLPTGPASIARYLAFVPGEGHGLGRAEARDFLHDLVKQLKAQGLGAKVVPGADLDELRAQFQALLAEAGERFRTGRIRTLVVVDGLDHVPREERPDRSFLRELPQPHAVPEGVVFVLGTQRLDLDGLPPAVRDEASRDRRCVRVAPLSREAVARLADASGVPGDVDRAALHERTQGHPLSARYVIGGLLDAPTAEARREWLLNGPAYGGDVDVFYERAWRELEGHAEARKALAYVALAEGPMLPASLDALIDPDATDAAWNAAGHLMARDRRGAWSIFHNSFRLFLRARTGTRHGLADEAGVRKRYRDLAGVARAAARSDPQRWMELRYRARAGDATAVADLATAGRFRTQFAEGRDPGDIQDDIGFAFDAAGELRRPELVVALVLARHEIAMRADAVGPEVFDALLALGDLDAALGLVLARDAGIGTAKGFELVDALLAAGRGDEGRDLFQRLEPLGALLGSEPYDIWTRDRSLDAWAERALVFRRPEEVLAALERLRPLEHQGERVPGRIDGVRTQAKLLAVRGQLNRDPAADPSALSRELRIAPGYDALLLCFAADAAYAAGDGGLAVERLQTVQLLAKSLGDHVRVSAAALAARLGRLDLAGSMLDGVAPPKLPGLDALFEGDHLRRACHAIVAHAAVST